MSTTSTIPATTTAVATATATGARSSDSRRASRALPVRAFARIAGVLFAAVLGLGLAGLNSSANAETVTGGVEFETTVECGGDYIDFIVNTTDLDSGSYAKLYVFDPYTQEWITDDVWEEADAYAGYHIPDISFEDGYYSVYMAYAQWTDNGWVYAGEYMDTYTQYYEDSSWTSSSCYMGF